jgi:hypothetical protein
MDQSRDQSRKNSTLDWSTEDEYWRSNFKNRPYAGKHDYSELQPAYRYGYESSKRYQNRKWEDVENDLRSGWTSYEHRGDSTWERAKGAVRDAWDRVTGNK